MSEITYTYANTDFVGATYIDLLALETTITNDVNITKSLKNIGRSIDGDNFNIKITFMNILDEAEETELNNIVANYTDDSIVNDSYFILMDKRTPGTNAGEFVKNEWITRTINYIDGSDEYVTLSDNTFTIQPGRYILNAKIPACNVNDHQARLRNITDMTYTYGTNASSNGQFTTTSDIYIYLILLEAKTYDIQHICSKTNPNFGLGKASGFNGDEIYTFISIQKI